MSPLTPAQRRSADEAIIADLRSDNERLKLHAAAMERVLNDRHQADRQRAWDLYAAASLSHGTQADFAAQRADRLMAIRDERGTK